MQQTIFTPIFQWSTQRSALTLDAFSAHVDVAARTIWIPADIPGTGPSCGMVCFEEIPANHRKDRWISIFWPQFQIRPFAGVSIRRSAYPGHGSCKFSGNLCGLSFHGHKLSSCIGRSNASTKRGASTI